MPTSAVSIFRSPLQAHLLALVILNPGRTWTARDLATRLEATHVSVHRELHHALDAGLLIREPLGRSYLYRAATDSPLYEPMRLLLERTVGVEPALREAIAEVPGVEAAFIHGSYAEGGRTRPVSDIDVLVIGDVDLHTLRKRVLAVEQRIGREIDVLAYTRDEFAQLARSGNSFARGVIRGPVRPLVGSTSDLPAAA